MGPKDVTATPADPSQVTFVIFQVRTGDRSTTWHNLRNQLGI